ncbi:MAG: acyl carrier protein [Pseudomonadales bacterium]
MDVSATIDRILINTCKVDKHKLGDPGIGLKQLDLDSLAILEAIFEIETEFDIELEDEQLSGLRSVSDLIAAVHTQLHKTT